MQPHIKSIPNQMQVCRNMKLSGPSYDFANLRHFSKTNK